MGGDKIDSLLAEQVQISRIAYVCTGRCAARFVKGVVVKTQSVLCYHNSVWVDINSDSVTAQEFALYESGSASTHLVKNELSRFGIFRDQVSRYVRAPISPIISGMGRPVAPTREAPNSEFFLLVILRRSEFFDSPRSTYLYVNIFYLHMLLPSDEPTVVVFGYELHSHQFGGVRHLLYLQNTSPCLFVGLD